MTRIDGLWVTSMVRTLVDLACDGAFRDAVAAIDHARHQHGGMIRPDDLVRTIQTVAPRRAARGRRAVDFSTELAMSPLESLSRVVIAELGFPRRVLQHVFPTSRGRRLVDFWWPAERVVGECDGKVKYEAERYVAGRSAADVMWSEKLRENELSSDGVRLARWTWVDCIQSSRLATRLGAAGLRPSPATPPTPRR